MQRTAHPRTGGPAPAATLLLAFGLLLLAACGPGDDPRDKIAAGPGGEVRNTQTYAREMFDAMCMQRGIGAVECTCMRGRMLRSGTRAMAYAGATYGGDLSAAVDIGEAMTEPERAAAIQAFFTAEAACLRTAAPDPDGGPALPGAGPGGDAPPAPATATLADVRASCSPAMAEICACRAQALRQSVGDGAYEAAIAINRGAPAALRQLASGREPGWADMTAEAYARTSAPCIVQAANRPR